MDRFLGQLKRQVLEYKSEVSVVLSKHIPRIDKTNGNSSKLHMEGGVITMRKGNVTYYPVSGEEPLREGQYFEVEVVEHAERAFAVGVAPVGLRDTVDGYKEAGSHSIHANGFLFSDGKFEKKDFKISKGDKITIRHLGKQLEWQLNKQPLCKVAIELTSPFLPFCWIRSSERPEQTSKLRFI